MDRVLSLLLHLSFVLDRSRTLWRLAHSLSIRVSKSVFSVGVGTPWGDAFRPWSIAWNRHMGPLECGHGCSLTETSAPWRTSNMSREIKLGAPMCVWVFIVTAPTRAYFQLANYISPRAHIQLTYCWSRSFPQYCSKPCSYQIWKISNLYFELL